MRTAVLGERMSEPYQRGDRSVAYAQLFGRGGKASSAFELLVEREATLDERLGEIEVRRFRAITLLIHPGFDDVRVARFDREDALKLYHALGNALMATEDDA